MRWPGFYAPALASLFLLLIPLIIFYFLKLKRPRMEVPSLALWRQVINDRRVNSPFQKFKRNLLLLLQLLVLCFLVLAAMQPFWPMGAERAEYLPVLIDCSASMAALDNSGGQSRLDEAKEHVRRLVNNLLPDQRLSLIAFHSGARRLTDFTDNKRVLHEALDNLAVSDLPSEVEEALRMTQALSRTEPIRRVVMFTDGNVPEQVDFELPFDLSYQKLEPAGRNIGVTALNARRTGASDWDVFVRIEASKTAEAAARVRVFQDDEEIADELVALEAGESDRLVFQVDSKDPAALRVELKPDGFDALPSDNVAYLDLPESRPLNVYVFPELAAFRHAMRALPGVDLNADGEFADTTAQYDLVISDKASEQALESTVKLLVGESTIPDDLLKLVGVSDGPAEVVDWRRSSSLLQHVQLAEVQFTDQPQFAEGTDVEMLEQLGYEVIAEARNGPLILQKRTAASLQYNFLFHPDQSTLPYRVGFPILVGNLMQIALEQAALSEARGAHTGVLPARLLEPEMEYRVKTPVGADRTAKTGVSGELSGVPAPHVGRYMISGGDQPQVVGVSLLDAGETSLGTVSELVFRELKVEAAETNVKTDRPLWSSLAIVALVLLLAEWWYFQRRPGGISM